MIPLRFKYDGKNIPIVSNSDIDSHAEQLLMDYDADLLSRPQEINVEDFAENYLKLRFHYTYLRNDGYILGRMVFHPSKIIVFNSEQGCADEEYIDADTIVIDNSLLEYENDHIFRSTVMHECGHSIYHDEYYSIDYYQLAEMCDDDISHLPYTQCSRNDISHNIASTSFKADRAWLEHQANYFSAAALMPRTTMKMLCLDEQLQKLCFTQYPGYENDALIAYISKIYNVSFLSAKIRLMQLGLTYISQNPAPDSFFTSGNYTSIPVV